MSDEKISLDFDETDSPDTTEKPVETNTEIPAVEDITKDEVKEQALSDYYRNKFRVDKLLEALSQAMQHSGHGANCPSRTYEDESRCNCWYATAREFFRC